MILSVTLNPSVDHHVFVDRIRLGDANRVIRTERDAGGKGVNLSRVVAELGSATLATGFLGGGPGAYVRAVLDRQGVEHCFVDIAGDTRINFSIEDESETPPTTFNDPGPQICEEDVAGLLARCREIAPRVRWAAIGGSVPPGAPPDIYATLIALFRQAGCRVMMDADGEAMRHGLAANPHFIKPNEKEAGRALDRPVDSLEAAARAAKDLLAKISDSEEPVPNRFVVVSRGADGAVLASAEGVFHGLPIDVEARSTVGSGDSLVGAMLWALENGHELREAFRWGLAAGAATAMTTGTEIARRAVILELLPKARSERMQA